VKCDDENTDSDEDSDEEVLERWVAYPRDIQRVLNLREELERARERERNEQISEQGVTPFTESLTTTVVRSFHFSPVSRTPKEQQR
jgi:hypothetical protein